MCSPAGGPARAAPSEAAGAASFSAPGGNPFYRQRPWVRFVRRGPADPLTSLPLLRNQRRRGPRREAAWLSLALHHPRRLCAHSAVGSGTPRPEPGSRGTGSRGHPGHHPSPPCARAARAPRPPEVRMLRSPRVVRPPQQSRPFGSGSPFPPAPLCVCTEGLLGAWGRTGSHPPWAVRAAFRTDRTLRGPPTGGRR